MIRNIAMWSGIGILLLILILVLITGTKGCSSSTNEDDHPLDYFASGTKHLESANREFKAGEKSRDRALRAQREFVKEYDDQDLKNSNQNQSTATSPAGPPALSDDEILLKAEEIAVKKGKVEDVARKLNGTASVTTPVAPAPVPQKNSGSKSYRPAPTPKSIINNYNNNYYYGGREEVSTKQPQKSVDMQKKSTSDCVGCDNAVPYSDEIRQRQLESKKNGYKKKDPLCILLPADPKFPNKPRGTIRFKNEKEKEEFLKNSGGLFREE